MSQLSEPLWESLVDMTWNYRVIKHVDTSETLYSIHEVYYDENGKPKMVSNEPVSVIGETPQELLKDLERQKEALMLPVLEYDLFTK